MAIKELGKRVYGEIFRSVVGFSPDAAEEIQEDDKNWAIGVLDDPDSSREERQIAARIVQQHKRNDSIGAKTPSLPGQRARLIDEQGNVIFDGNKDDVNRLTTRL